MNILQVALLEEMAANGETLNEDMLNYPDQSGRVSAIWGMVEGRPLSTWVPALIISLQMFLETTIYLYSTTLGNASNKLMLKAFETEVTKRPIANDEVKDTF